MILREMTADDLTAVVKIEREAFSMPWSQKGFEDAIYGEHTLFLVAEENKDILGYCGMYLSADEGEITNIAVKSDKRSRHTGSALLETSLAMARERGAQSIYLEVRVGNEAAIGLYEKYGFKRVGTRKNFYEKPKEDAFVYVNQVTDC